MTDTRDLIVIGAGMAGINVAKKCSKAGWSVAIVDELPYGGTSAQVPRRSRPHGCSQANASRARRGSIGQL